MNRNSLKKIGFTLLTAAVVSTSLLPSISDAANGKYKLKTSAKTFINTDDASRGVNVRGTYNAGEYYIFRELNDYVNISRAEGIPGAWIKKSDNGTTVATKSETKTETKQTVSLNGNKLTLSSPAKIYMNAADAKAERNSRGTYAAGEYYVYKSFNGSYNISKAANQPGGWVHGLDKAPVTTQTPAPVNTTTNTADKYTLTSSRAGYVNASYAKYGTNSSTTLAAGEYYVYKKFDGMLNLSRQKNVPGAWVNPNGQAATSKVSSSTGTTNKTAPTNTSSSSSIGQQIVREARRHVGARYVYAGSNPSTGFDCSGLTSYVLRQVKGISISRSSRAQAQGGTYVNSSNLQAGDLLFYGSSPSNIFHVGIYNGNGGIIHASDYGIGVVEVSTNSNFFRKNFQFAKRY